MTPGRRGDGREPRSATSRHRATWGTERGEWKGLGEVSRGQQSISYIHEGHEKARREPCVFFVHEEHEKTRREDFKENRPGQASAPLWALWCRRYGVALRASSRLPHNDSTTPYGGQVCPCRKLLRIKLRGAHKIELPITAPQPFQTSNRLILYFIRTF
jgi:hypothetical protein